MTTRFRPVGFDFIDNLPATEPEPCPYLPERRARYRAFLLDDDFPPLAYHRLMDAAFRRSGDYCYQPVCDECQACVPLRVPVSGFAATSSQKRVQQRNRDLQVEVSITHYSDEQYQLYRRYVQRWHGKAEVDEADFRRFLVDSPVNSISFQYRDESGRLVAVGVCDVCALSLSSVYFYFEPDEHRRSLGTLGALVEIAWAASRGIPHYYLGYWVAGSRTMDYKSRFGPHEVLTAMGWAAGEIRTGD